LSPKNQNNKDANKSNNKTNDPVLAAFQFTIFSVPISETWISTMPSIFDGLDEVCDKWLGVDASWQGKPPHYPHKTTLQQLCQNGWGDLCGQQLMKDLYNQILKNWAGGPCTGQENWRFEKQPNLNETSPMPEVALERTITRISDANWVNQVPVASGINGIRGSNDIDLIFRTGASFTFIELKVASNHPLYAAFQIVKYGMVYIFSRIHTKQLGYQMKNKELLRANEVRLQVLAPPAFYAAESIKWLRSLELCLNNGLEVFAQKELQIPMSFNFFVFPTTFAWNPACHEDLEVRKNLLWALHNTTPLDGH
jgi:hypothetical protein